MSKNFDQISNKPGFMKHNGGIMFKAISETEYEFKSIINENHLNNLGITHGGYICSLIDSGAGTAARRAADNRACVTVSLELKFISTTKKGDEVIGFAKILKKTKTMVFLICHLKSNEKIVASASGVWKILNINSSKSVQGG
tara:strand:+ start:146 stop:571 length:426 start_codon:yes stop_codon:yes gene_type:complete